MKSREEIENNQPTSHGEFHEEVKITSKTEGGVFEDSYISLAITRIVEPVLMALPRIEDVKIVEQAKEIILIIIELVRKLSRPNYDISNLPPIVANILDDGSLSIEWLFINYRVGFVLEGNPRESIWYLISKDEKTDTNKSGMLSIVDKRELLRMLVEHVALNS